MRATQMKFARQQEEEENPHQDFQQSPDVTWVARSRGP
jgi:hypothetical protein